MKKLLILICIITSVALNAQQYYAIVGGTVINPVLNKKTDDAVVLIKDSIIVKVGSKKDVKIPEKAIVIDAKGKYIIAGLVDGHIHFFQSGGLYTRPDVIDLNRLRTYDKEMEMVKSSFDDVFRRYITSGVTTVVDMGGPFWNFDVKDKSVRTEIAPRVFICGPLISSYDPPNLDKTDPPIIKVTTAEEGVALVKKQLINKPDFIKIWYVLKKGVTVESFLPVVKAIVAESHKNNIKVIVHAMELETARASIEAGCDILAHSVYDAPIPDDLLALMKKNNVIYVPTMMVKERYDNVFAQTIKLHPAEYRFADPEVVKTFFDMKKITDQPVYERIQARLKNNTSSKAMEIAADNLRRVNQAGITIAVGTDAGNIGTLHGPSIFREMEMMREAGLSNNDVLKMATLGGAKLINKEKQLGTVEGGKLADLLILNSDPTADINNAADIKFVMKNGKLWAHDSIYKPTNAEIIQQEVNSYNMRDIVNFAKFYSPDVVLYNYADGKEIARGNDVMYKIYEKMFSESPNLFCDIQNRIVQGNYVIDKERVTGMRNSNKVSHVVALYELEKGKIKKCWFLR